MLARFLAHHDKHLQKYIVTGAIIGGGIPAAVCGHLAAHEERGLADPEVTQAMVVCVPAGFLFGAVVGMFAPAALPVAAHRW